ncbi:Multiheme cytochromes domain-containing protein [Dioscorea alata]|uniref:Multiheme cytochromes domain-containing protein n=1 Tax=Dioscorea alata TaxID=55571 RepID=A0ACB7TT25_DIOAL|nr:Multiheme cytochromes domain-containing protein [Dioscorea alata]
MKMEFLAKNASLDRSLNLDDECSWDGDASPTSYTSCEGSDFDKYCSANSVLGTASVCSSIGRRAESPLDRSISHAESCSRALSEYKSSPGGGSAPCECFSDESGLVQHSDDEEDGDIRGKMLDLFPSPAGNRQIDGSLEDEDGLLGDWGTDDEDGSHQRQKNGIFFQSSREINSHIGNPLLMTSSVAFGASDWDEFELDETRGDDLFAPSLYHYVQNDEQEGHLIMERSSSVPVVDHASALHLNGLKQDGEMRDTVPTQIIDNVAIFGLDVDEDSGDQIFGDNTSEQLHSETSMRLHGEGIESQDGSMTSSFLLMGKNGHETYLKKVEGGKSVEECQQVDEVKKSSVNDTYEEMVLEMEEILLESGKPQGPWVSLAKEIGAAKQSQHFRDGSSTASTSGTDEAFLFSRDAAKIDWVEVVGAKQKQGDVSLGERLVGVKEYTSYRLRVWSGNDQWEIERRYRDFFAFYKQLKILFTNSGLPLPSPWSNVDRESFKFFGNASPNVISERSTLIQDCLRSILHCRLPIEAPRIFALFFSPNGAVSNSVVPNNSTPRFLQKTEDENEEVKHSPETAPGLASPLGKTISLIVELKPNKSIRQLLEAQHYACAGCHMHLNARKTLLQELVQKLKWHKPRLCEYTGQLFCGSCHTNDTAVLPAKVLHLWDFSLYPVSQLAKSYLESIYDQPMLCVSAVNPVLFSKVPALLHVMSVRKRIAAMFPFLRCPFRSSIQRGLGFRRHLLESNDFFALRDLVDLSKGAFAALPVVVETISSKIFEHITQQCLVCCDAGVPCAARQSCDDPSSFIFPFQDDEAMRCRLCGSIFHKPCFRKLDGCSCGKPLRAGNSEDSTGQVIHVNDTESNGVLDRFVRQSDALSGMLSNLLKARPAKRLQSKKSSPVILMGSLPSTSL